MVRSIFAEAVVLLADDHEDPGVRDACACLLATALEAGLDIPGESAMALWRWLIGPGAGRSWYLAHTLGNVRSEGITAEAVDILLKGDISREVRTSSVDVLSGPMHAPGVEDNNLVQLAETWPEDAEQIARLIRARHESRPASREVLVSIRDTWTAANHPSARIGSIHVATLLDIFDHAYWRRMIHDLAVDVRIAVAQEIAQVDPTDKSLLIVRERLLVERVNEAKAEMLISLGKLVHRLEGN